MFGSACCLMKGHHFNGIHVTGWLPVMRQSRPAQPLCLKSCMCNLTGSEQSFHTTSSLLLFSTHPPSLWFPLWIIAGLILHSGSFTFPLWDFTSECQTLAAIRSAEFFAPEWREKEEKRRCRVSPQHACGPHSQLSSSLIGRLGFESVSGSRRNKSVRV